MPNDRYKIDESRKVYVYKNLHKDCYSVKQDGLVKLHTHNICLWDASFRVGKKGRERVLNEKRKNVHAGVSGYIDTDWNDENYPDNTRSVIYNPYKYESFVDGSKETPVYWSSRVRLSHGVLANGKGVARIDAVPCIESANRY